VNAIAPGITDTDMVGASMSEAVIQETIAHTKLGRIGKPSEITAAALFLASDLSSYVTGQVLRVDGGLEP
jgi:3-oxoacyl-[acyl-carrier protein] reductase